LRDDYPLIADEIVLIHAGLDISARTDIVDKFDGRAVIPEGERQPRILVGTVETLGKGFTCVRAQCVVLMEPGFVQCVEVQVYSRIRRIGQQAKTVYSYRICCPDITLEDNIMKRQSMMAWIEEQISKAQAEVRAAKAVNDQAQSKGHIDLEEDRLSEYA